jgi:hypothetical protein
MKLIVFLIGATSLLLMEGCSGYSNPDQIVFPADSVSYAKDIEPFFALSCNASGCHNAIDMAGGVDLSSWIGIRAINVATPGDTNSELILVLKGQGAHPAPFSANQNQIEGVTEWVREGAPNN